MYYVLYRIMYNTVLYLYYVLRYPAYGKLCKDFSSERRYTGRKYLLPKKLSKRTLIKVYRNGDYDIHDNITQGAILVSQKDAPWFHKANRPLT